jgi:glutaredoxin 3
MATVELYTKATCGYCMMAKRMLDRKGVTYTEYPVGSDAPKFDEMVRRSDGGRTVPQIFINDMHVGGFDDLNGLDRAGNLDPLLKG